MNAAFIAFICNNLSICTGIQAYISKVKSGRFVFTFSWDNNINTILIDTYLLQNDKYFAKINFIIMK
ncbi:hypothetical protein AM231_10470 [Paenibacillus solani]|uniref:Uncharacterized protein n=1 Tax=Paenibacillus solani TaxID=1705565 RepID=A0A0M1P4V9_9BACL|nr:hypothetical protein AM231_10470 [Paenibacillus solani]